MVTQEILKKMYSYDSSGFFINKKTGNWVLGKRCKRYGYQVHAIRIDGKNRMFRYHRLIYLFHFGFLPGELDHINGIRHDNRIENLRPSNRVHNNARKDGYGKRGLPKGVYRKKKSNKFFSMITVSGELHYLGSFDSVEEAEVAFKKKHFSIYGDLS